MNDPLLDIEIDQLTNSIQNTVSGDSFDTEVAEVAKTHLKNITQANGWKFACKVSWDKGYEGFVAFQSKTKLIEHYETTLGATHIGGHKMIIFPPAALQLIHQYFKK